MRVLVVGADGFLGRHIAFDLRQAGVEVIAHARRTGRLAEMGFAVLRADLSGKAAQDPAFWTPNLAGLDGVVWAAGLLTGREGAFAAVHEAAPRALLEALPAGAGAVLISAVGIDAGTTPFARWRLQTEALFAARGAAVLRPGLVVAETSYGGTSLLRALAAMPWRMPVVGDGDQRFNPIHAADLAEVVRLCLTTPPGPGPWEVGGPETLTQADLMRGMRAWLGLPPVPVLRLPDRLVWMGGAVGDALSLGPVSRMAVEQFAAGVLADPAPLIDRLKVTPRGLSAILAGRPAGTQDLWHARLYLLRPMLRLVLAVMWLASGLLGLLLPPGTFLPQLPAGPPDLLVALARVGGAADLALAAALAVNLWPRTVARAQIALVLAYTLGLTVLAPGLWLDPFGGLLKNLPVLALLFVHLALVEER